VKLASRIRTKLAGKRPSGEPVKKTPGETDDTYDLASWPDGSEAREHYSRKHRHHDAQNRFSLPMSAH
jgi:hypothetical protein